MNIAFYAPLKPPDHPNPSGDRLLARLMIAALERAGHRVWLASTTRSFEGAGDARRQRRIRADAEREADDLIDRWRGSACPDLWLSYHVYHKAPDWIGPRVCEALSLPYVIAEASVSPSQAGGAWCEGHEQARRCVSRADAVIALNRRDVECTRPLMRHGAPLVRMAPFIDLDGWPPSNRRTPGETVRMVTVARMRHGDKARSWRLLADWIGRLTSRRWTFDVVGDGNDVEDVRYRLSESAGDRIRFHGRLEGAALAAVLDAGDLFVWPAVNEAFGMALIEAQSRSLAVVAGRNGGVPEVVTHGRGGLLVDLADPGAAARTIDYLLRRPAVIERMGREALENVRARHTIGAATATLDHLVRELCANST